MRSIALLCAVCLAGPGVVSAQPPGPQPNIPSMPKISWKPVDTGEQLIRLLADPSIRKQLDLSEGVPAKLTTALRAFDAEKEEPKPASEYFKAVEESLGEIRTKRLAELRLQGLGLKYGVAQVPELDRELKLSDEQRKSLSALRVPGVPERMGGISGQARLDAELKILNDKQQEVWKKQVGATAPDKLPLLLVIQVEEQPIRLPQQLPGSIYARLLNDPNVVKELGLTAAQSEKLPDLIDRLNAEDEEFRTNHPGPFSDDELVDLLRDRQKAASKTIAQALSKQAADRCGQIIRQAQGLLGSLRGDPEVMEILNVSEDQNRKLAMLIQSGALPPPPPPPADVTQLRDLFREYKRTLNQIIVEEILTKAQQDQWKELSGEELDFDVMVMPILPPRRTPQGGVRPPAR